VIREGSLAPVHSDLSQSACSSALDLYSRIRATEKIKKRGRHLAIVDDEGNDENEDPNAKPQTKRGRYHLPRYSPQMHNWIPAINLTTKSNRKPPIIFANPQIA
jgi:hypothetical protein